MLLADYLVLNGPNGSTKLSNLLHEQLGIDVSESTIRSWAYYRKSGKTTTDPKPVEIQFTRDKKIKDIVVLQKSLLEPRLNGD